MWFSPVSSHLTTRRQKCFKEIMSASMASVSMRQVVSPRNLAGALISPQVNHSLKAVFRNSQVEPWSPHSVSSLKKSPSLSPYMAKVLSPFSNHRNHLERAAPQLSKRGRSARKLPWSDGGKHSSCLGVCTAPNSVLSHGDVSDSISKCRSQPSVDTPDRAETLRSFNQKSGGIHVLGKGSFGTVIEAIYKGKTVAVKIVQPNPEACRQIRNEMNCLRFSHPNIVSIFKVALPDDDDVTAGVVIMERVSGYTLQKILDNDLLNDKIRQRIRYSMQISSALAYCHDHGVLHLDVKPQNVLVDIYSDNCRLCDFGCSLLIGSESFSLQGTIGYVAPEVLQGNKPTSAADVYSLGLTMWQLMSGECPYKDLRGHAVIYKVVAVAHRPQLPVVRCAEDATFLSLVQRCWSQSSESRPSIQEVLAELTMEYNKNCKGMP